MGVIYCKGHEGTFCCDENIFILIRVHVGVYIYQNTWNYTLKMYAFIVCKLCLHEVD